MIFLVQREIDPKLQRNSLDIDSSILLDLIEKEKYLHTYQFCTLKDMQLGNILSTPKMKEAIPLGSIEFVTAYFQRFYNIEKMNPIEIPPCLRTKEFLKRDYQIVKASDIPQNGEYFIKDVSQLKVFSYNGEMSYFMRDDIALHLNRNHLFQVSERVDILSEWRVYILDGEIYNIANYEGNPCIFPDINLIEKANRIYSTQADFPKSYTMDIMVIQKKEEIQTALIECHILFSTGLYNTVWGTNWLYGYRDSKDYVLRQNSEISK